MLKTHYLRVYRSVYVSFDTYDYYYNKVGISSLELVKFGAKTP